MTRFEELLCNFMPYVKTNIAALNKTLNTYVQRCDTESNLNVVLAAKNNFFDNPKVCKIDKSKSLLDSG